MHADDQVPILQLLGEQLKRSQLHSLLSFDLRPLFLVAFSHHSVCLHPRGRSQIQNGGRFVQNSINEVFITNQAFFNVDQGGAIELNNIVSRFFQIFPVFPPKLLIECCVLLLPFLANSYSSLSLVVAGLHMVSPDKERPSNL